MKKIIKQIVIFIIFLSIFPVINPLLAQTELPLVVMPVRQEIEVSPGEATNLTVNFYNKSDSPISGFVKIADFIVLDNQGTPTILEDSSQAPTRFAASNWFKTTIDRAAIAANEKVTIPLSIEVPKDAYPGGRYVAVFFEPIVGELKPTQTTKEAGSTIAPRLASLVYLKIKGNVRESALVTRFFTPGFLEYGPITVKTEILNRSDYHISPKGVITLSNIFGSPVDQVKLKETNIFPDTVRDYENSLGQKWMIGKYKLTLTASYGEKGGVLERSVYLWVFPWRVALVIVLTLIIISLFISNVYKTFIKKEKTLEEELAREKEEIEKLKKELKKN
jgi:hypothetical protein